MLVKENIKDTKFARHVDMLARFKMLMGLTIRYNTEPDAVIDVMCHSKFISEEEQVKYVNVKDELKGEFTRARAIVLGGELLNNELNKVVDNSLSKECAIIEDINTLISKYDSFLKTIDMDTIRARAATFSTDILRNKKAKDTIAKVMQPIISEANNGNGNIGNLIHMFTQVIDSMYKFDKDEIDVVLTTFKNVINMANVELSLVGDGEYQGSDIPKRDIVLEVFKETRFDISKINANITNTDQDELLAFNELVSAIDENLDVVKSDYDNLLYFKDKLFNLEDEYKNLIAEFIDKVLIKYLNDEITYDVAMVKYKNFTFIMEQAYYLIASGISRVYKAIDQLNSNIDTFSGIYTKVSEITTMGIIGDVKPKER